MFCACAGEPSGKDLTALGDIKTHLLRVLIVELQHLVCTEPACAFSLRTETVGTLARALLIVLIESSRHCVPPCLNGENDSLPPDGGCSFPPKPSRSHRQSRLFARGSCSLLHMLLWGLASLSCVSFSLRVQLESFGEEFGLFDYLFSTCFDLYIFTELNAQITKHSFVEL